MSGLKNRKVLLANGVHVFVLGNFAVGQPLLEVMAGHAEFFVARHSEPIDIFLLVFFLCIVVPGIVACFDILVQRFYPRSGRYVHGMIIGALFTVLALPALKKTEGLSDFLLLSMGLGAGLLGAGFYHFFRPVRMVLTVLFPAPIIFIVLFLLNPQIQQVVFPEDSFEGPPMEVTSGASVVMVIFDELPLTSLLDDKGEIDAYRYPHFSAFARGSTWYRNTTSISGITTVAVPAILTGNYPGKNLVLQTAENHPRNLFTLLGSSYQLHVQESLSQLCPKQLCEREILKPPFGMRLQGLISDVMIVYGHILFPETLSRRLPSIQHTWGNFGGVRVEPGGDHGKTGIPKDVDKHVLWTDWSNRFSSYVDLIEPSDQPTLHFIHVLLPHVPWRYLPSGKTYGSYGVGFLGIDGLEQERWSDDSWAVAQGFQRHLLQLGFADRLFGLLLERLREIGIYDSALVVVTADHGASFRTNDYFRRPSPSNYDDIMHVPLFIKAPGQSKPMVRDIHVETIDIFPTMADILGIEISWKVDGQSVWESKGHPRNRKIIFDTSRQRINRPMVFPEDQEGFQNTLSQMRSLFGSGRDPYRLYRIGPYGHMVGSSIDEVSVSGISDLEIEMDKEVFSPNPVTGRVFLPDASHKGPLHVAIVIDEKVGAVTRSYSLSKTVERFSAFVPEEYLEKENPDIDAYWVSGDSRQPILKKISIRHSSGFSLLSGETGDRLVSSEGKHIPVISEGEKTGAVTQVIVKDRRMIFKGWVLQRGQPSGSDSILILKDGQSIFQGRPNRFLPNESRGAHRSQGFEFDLPLNWVSQDSDIQLLFLSNGKEAIRIGWMEKSYEGLRAERGR